MHCSFCLALESESVVEINTWLGIRQISGDKAIEHNALNDLNASGINVLHIISILESDRFKCKKGVTLKFCILYHTVVDLFIFTK